MKALSFYFSFSFAKKVFPLDLISFPLILYSIIQQTQYFKSLLFLIRPYKIHSISKWYGKQRKCDDLQVIDRNFIITRGPTLLLLRVNNNNIYPYSRLGRNISRLITFEGTIVRWLK